MVDAKRHSRIWMACTDRRTPPSRISSPASEDSPRFLPDGDIGFRALENGSNFLFRMEPGGSDRHKVLADRILDLNAVCPDGRWIVLNRPISGGENPVIRSAVLIDGQRRCVLGHLCRRLGRIRQFDGFRISSASFHCSGSEQDRPAASSRRRVLRSR